LPRDAMSHEWKKKTDVKNIKEVKNPVKGIEKKIERERMKATVNTGGGRVSHLVWDD
jgi:hypothetical protein